VSEIPGTGGCSAAVGAGERVGQKTKKEKECLVKPEAGVGKICGTSRRTENQDGEQRRLGGGVWGSPVAQWSL